MLQPFQRLAHDRVGHGDGLGLGLSIVAAIAERARRGARRQAWLGRADSTIEVRFPRAPDADRVAASPADANAVEVGLVET